ncbi:unnamed protein product [Mytilus coruscus]|uniref:BTB domain-containing protein n=1 Tax=Mytilus coruscus TaxID=42192 RepID=A0A6J8E0B6_MYTCO|nr:unnamed protein product [Mytilus coruscus]
MESTLENLNISEQFPEVITINVGGFIFTTTIGTLRKYPQSGLAVMFGNNVFKDKDGNYFIDRNGKYFQYILSYLRDESCLPPVKIFKQVLVEAKFYNLKTLVTKLETCETKYDFSAKFPNVTPTYHAIREKISRFGLKTTLLITLRETSNRKWDGWPSGSGHYYFHTGSISVTCQNSDEAHSLINCLWKDLYLAGFEADMEVLEFSNAVVCKFELKPEVLFNS